MRCPLASCLVFGLAVVACGDDLESGPELVTADLGAADLGASELTDGAPGLDADVAVDASWSVDASVTMDASSTMDASLSEDAEAPTDLGEPPATVCDTAPDPSSYQEQVHHFTNEAGTRRIQLQRNFAGLGGGLTSAWTLAWMRIDDGPCVTEASQLEYVWTHHNFEDEAHLTMGGIEHIVGAEIQLVEPFAIVTTYRARRTSDDGIVVSPETLVHIAGPTWPF